MSISKDKKKEVILENQKFSQSVSLIRRSINIQQNFNYIFVGLRRAGKSFLLFQRIQDLLSEGHSIDEILYFNFEDDRLDGMELSDLDLLLQCYGELFSHKPFVFLDEIQNIDGWEKFARRLADNKYSVCITGSNAKMLSKEMATVLGGRFLVQNVFPFSFEEYLSLNDIKLDSVSVIRDKNRIVREFEIYFYNGGLPELHYAQETEKRMWLSNLYNKIYFGDLVSRYKIRNERAVKLLIKKIAESVKQPSSYTRLANIVSSCGSKVKSETIAEYLNYAEEAWLIFHVENLFAKLSERESVKKYYITDNGILNLFLTDPNTSLLENLVAITLLRKGYEFYYYRSADCEVDFVLPEEKTAIQVCYSLFDDETREREFAALFALSKRYELNSFSVISKDTEETLEYKGLKIKVIPAWKWILAKA
ncbi:MAG: ATP-binding protein [Spirochaetaceae bacterium]|nr:ATP-binding protein [Spirochaetaceae bacterium]